ncbi:MAG: phytanoyl-CoA dioxygenase family protein [Myxococcota bacterium]
MWIPAQRSEFDERGFVRLRHVFSRAEAAAMEERLWASLNRKHGVRRDDPSSWKIPLGAGLRPLRTHAVFRPIGGPAVLGALDELIGEGRWQEPKHWGQFLVSFPVAEGDFSRSNWHTDFPYFLPRDRVVGALVFSFVGEVPSGTGGTLVIAGSHKVVGRFVGANPHLRKVKMKVARQALMNSDPWLKALGAEADEEGWVGRFMAREHAIADIPVRVVELTGEPGDVVIGHPWLLHTPSPNRGDRPRFMRVQRIRPAEQALPPQ